MRFDIISIFPDMLKGPISESILARAAEAGKIEIRVHNLRDWAKGKHLMVDDTPFGGGDGMVMKPEPLFEAIEAVKEKAPGSPVVLLTPQGKPFDQETAQMWSGLPGLILVCGHYAGVDERVRQHAVDFELSIGDYVLTGGELPALVVIDAVARLLPGVLGNDESAQKDSFPNRIEWPQYTRPAEYRGMKAPEVLVSGNHGKIEEWKKEQSLLRTLERRPDLLEKFPPDEEEQEILKRIEQADDPED